MDKHPVQKMILHQPSLEEVAGVLQTGLSKNFTKVEVKVVDCPDLSQAPFDLADKALCGRPRLADVGGPDYLLPLPAKDKNYTYQGISALCELHTDALLLGAGAGPHETVGVNSELICNAKLGGPDKTRLSTVDKDGSCNQFANQTGTFSLMANLFLCEGKPGKVLQVKAAHRTGAQNFVECLHNTLTWHYGEQRAVGLGGAFLLEAGSVKTHIMPDFTKTALETVDEIMDWLNFYAMDAPLVNVGTIVSADPQNLFLRKEHFHCFSDHGQAGHYEHDTTPETAAYLGYFNVAEELYRIDLPETRRFLF